MQRNNRFKRGFTLVEMAVVMVVIGLLIGGILKGETLLEAARIDRTIRDVRDIQTAALTFREKYGTWPGDLSSATRRLVGCDASTFCQAGDGNGQVGVTWMGISPAPLCAPPDINSCEPSMFWKHLSLAGMISGVSPGADTTNPAGGVSHPAPPVGGVFHVFYNAFPAPNRSDFGAANTLLLTNALYGRINKGIGGNVLTPHTAERMDWRHDNGNSNTGWISADSVSSLCDVDNLGPEPFGTYKTSSSTKNCIMFFNLQ